MGRFKQGDYVKIEVLSEVGDLSEWMWLLVDDSDDARRVVFGKLDSEPVLNKDMRLGMQLAVSYDKIREHRTSSSFDQ